MKSKKKKKKWKCKECDARVNDKKRHEEKTGHTAYVTYEFIGVGFPRRIQRQIKKEEGDDGSECVMCHRDENLLQHHITYEPEERMTLCSSCHFMLHKATGRIG